MGNITIPGQRVHPPARSGTAAPQRDTGLAGLHAVINGSSELARVGREIQKQHQRTRRAADIAKAVAQAKAEYDKREQLRIAAGEPDGLYQEVQAHREQVSGLLGEIPDPAVRSAALAEFARYAESREVDVLMQQRAQAVQRLQADFTEALTADQQLLRGLLGQDQREAFQVHVAQMQEAIDSATPGLYTPDQAAKAKAKIQSDAVDLRVREGIREDPGAVVDALLDPTSTEYPGLDPAKAQTRLEQAQREVEERSRRAIAADDRAERRREKAMKAAQEASYAQWYDASTLNMTDEGLAQAKQTLRQRRDDGDISGSDFVRGSVYLQAALSDAPDNLSARQEVLTAVYGGLADQPQRALELLNSYRLQRLISSETYAEAKRAIDTAGGITSTESYRVAVQALQNAFGVVRNLGLGVEGPLLAAKMQDLFTRVTSGPRENPQTVVNEILAQLYQDTQLAASTSLNSAGRPSRFKTRDELELAWGSLNLRERRMYSALFNLQDLAQVARQRVERPLTRSSTGE